MPVFGLQKILSLIGLLGQNIVLLCHYAKWKRIMDNQIAIFLFFLFCSVSPFSVFLFTVRKLRLFFSVFGEFQVPPIGLEYALQCVESFSMDLFGRKYSWNDAKEDKGKKIALDLKILGHLRWQSTNMPVAALRKNSDSCCNTLHIQKNLSWIQSNRCQLLALDCFKEELNSSLKVRSKWQNRSLTSWPPESPIKQHKSQDYWADFMATRWHGLPVN